jgi:hypothetical protein
MAVVKKRNQQTESRLLLESNEPVELPPAEVDDSAVILQFEQFRQHVPELLEELRDGVLAEPVPVMMDGSTFVIHADTRSFWVKLWHSSPEQTRIERVQVISCLPSTRGVQLVVGDLDGYADDDDDYDDEEDLDDADLDADDKNADVNDADVNNAGVDNIDDEDDAV